ncbi:MAG: hypothetical protein QOH47_2419 [Sphingomonadales bacterium]|jgi:hypothetical protein|nr:hypothetical protein [Sphingomonadales bacterium]
MKWLLYRADGTIAEQVCTVGRRSPTEGGANPDGLREVKVSRHGCLATEHYDLRARRWRKDPARVADHAARERKAAERFVASLPGGVVEIIAELVAKRLGPATSREGEADAA